MAILLLTALAGAQSPVPIRPSFSEWLAEIRTEALSRGIKPSVVDEALAGIDEPLAIVVERDRAQAEAVLPLETYISRGLRARTVTTARTMFARHRVIRAASSS